MFSHEYSNEERGLLLEVARRSIMHGLERNVPLQLNIADFSQHLRQRRACFVTLRCDGELRGCTGAIAAQAPLVVCVAEHAFTSAFRDLRFLPLMNEELSKLDISISVLSEPEALTFVDEQDLLSQLRPGEDGLILEEGRNLGTLLPSVWEALPNTQEFVRQLKRKAGLPGDYWSKLIRVSRYTTEEFAEDASCP